MTYRLPVRAQLRILLIGGVTSYRALFNWIRPAILIPTFMVVPLFQILLFVYLGRSAHLQSDRYYILGNALETAAFPCLVGMMQVVTRERQQHTLQLVLVTPAPRTTLFLGRALPVIANGFFVSALALLVASLILGSSVPPGAVLPLLLTILVASLSCTGLGLINAAFGLRVRETAVLSNLILGLLLVVCGVNVPLSRLPGWVAGIAEFLPLTHGIAAARRLADGAGISAVAGQLALEIAIAVSYAVVGLGFLLAFERESRRTASLDRI
jgi:ABC-2 type transport system permease protein